MKKHRRCGKFRLTPSDYDRYLKKVRSLEYFVPRLAEYWGEKGDIERFDFAAVKHYEALCNLTLLRYYAQMVTQSYITTLPAGSQLLGVLKEVISLEKQCYVQAVNSWCAALQEKEYELEDRADEAIAESKRAWKEKKQHKEEK